MRPVSIHLPLISLSLFVSLALHAQDTRTVTEPKIPPACVTLQADVAANHGVIALADEQRLSTGRIQDALDHCAAPSDGSSSESKSVVLRAHGKKNVFLTGPLTLRPGVTLVVEQKHRACRLARSARLRSLARLLRHRLNAWPRLQAAHHRRRRKERRHHGRGLHRRAWRRNAPRPGRHLVGSRASKPKSQTSNRASLR